MFMLTPENLSYIGIELLKIPHVRRIRFATKGLAVLPMRITNDDTWTEDHLEKLLRLAQENNFEFVSITDTAFGYNPGIAPQSVVIELVPCPPVIAPPPPIIVHWYVDVGVLVTKWISPVALTHTVSGLIVV